MSSQPNRPPARERLRRAGHEAAERLRRAGRALRQRSDRVPAPTGPRKPAGAGKKALYWTGGGLALLAVAMAAFLLLFDWNWMRGPIARLASARIHREVAITGDLDVRLWSWRPSATVHGLQIGNPKWAGPRRMADIDRLTVQIRLAPLFAGHVDLALLDVSKPRVSLRKDAQGRANWDFSDGRAKGQPLKLPPIRRFLIEDGALRYTDDRRKLAFAGAINAVERLQGANRGFELSGDGALNRAPFHLKVTGGPLLNIDRNRPYPFDALVRAGATHVAARGAIARPFDLGRYYMNMTVEGPDLANLYDLTGVTFPNTPAYRLSGRFVRDEQLYSIHNLGGRVGTSDLAGDLSVDRSGARPLLRAALSSRSLDFDDLAPLFGAPPRSGAGGPAPAQPAGAQQRLLPDATLKVDRLRAMDARVDYRAASIRDAPIPLRSGAVTVNLDRGLLTADPIEFDLLRGRLTGRVHLNARQATPVTDLDLRLTDARLEQLIPARGGEAPLTGSLVARARLSGAGDSVHRAASAANGEAMVVVPGGEIRKAFAELLGVNVVKGLGLLLSKDQATTPVRCAVAHFQAKDGVLVADRLIFDTGPVLGTGDGSVNLGTERLDFRITGHPKTPQLLRVRAPITVKGSIRAPQVGVEAGGAVAQGGVAAVLGAVASPLAVVLPFIDLGLTKDAACGALIAEAGRQGAPVKSARR